VKKWRIVVFSYMLLVAFGIGIGAGIFIQKLNGPPALIVAKDSISEFKLVEQAWNIITSNYVDRTATQPKTLAYGTIEGMVDSLGDTGHSTFLTPEEIKLENEVIQGQYEEIGAEVGEKNGNVVIVAPYDGSPAQKAGLQSGDIILKVDGLTVTGVEDAVSRITGPAGTSVTLTIENSSGLMRDVTIVRAEINLTSVTWQILPGTSIADLRLASFSNGTSTELDTALTAIAGQGVTGIILDLRNNGGGLLNEAEGVASRFLTGGNVLEEKDINGNIKKDPVIENVPKTDLPLVVLVNQGTASAAEIVAGALQGAGRAKLIGELTFGTGTALVPFPLPDGSEINLGVTEWLTPSGKSIWHVGLSPDVTISLASGVTPLSPESEKGLTLDQIKASGDQQLLSALNLLQ
jgi:carboxyl-terminal processing protease